MEYALPHADPKMTTFNKADSLINKGIPSDAIYVANCLDEIIKQMTGSRHNSDAFHRLFLRLLARMFGEKVSLVGNCSEEPTWTKSVPGGWLKVMCETYSKTGNTDFKDEFQFLSSGAAKLTRHFIYRSALFDLIAELGGECNVQLSMFPLRCQLYISDHPAYVPLQSDNTMKILCLLLRINSLIPMQVCFICCLFPSMFF